MIILGCGLELPFETFEVGWALDAVFVGSGAPE